MKKNTPSQDSHQSSGSKAGSQRGPLDLYSTKPKQRRTALGKKRINKQQQVIDFSTAKSDALSYKRATSVNLIPRNIAQEGYVDNLNDDGIRITFAVGAAGTGKTLLATMKAIQMLRNKTISRIVVTRPAVSVDEQHGFLPGDLNQKMEPWTRPIFDVFEEYWSPQEIKCMIEERIIEIAPLAYMRGRTFKYCYIIADEMQLSTVNQMKMLLTRVGTGTYMSVTGDSDQRDFGQRDDGLLDFVDKISKNNTSSISISCFDHTHVERDPIVEEVLKLYDAES